MAQGARGATVPSSPPKKGRNREVARIDFAPGAAKAASR